MDERYTAFMAEVMYKEAKKPPAERSAGLATDWQRLKWWHRQQMGRPAESIEEEAWRKSFDP